MKKVFVAGHNGMVGSALVKQLLLRGDVEVITKSSSALDLRDQSAIITFFKQHKIEEIYLAAAKVGGIHANFNFPAEFIYDNIAIALNIIHAAHKCDINKLIFLGSSCIYPKFAIQPIPESELLNGHLEATNEPYAIAKIAGIKLCESYNRQYGRDFRAVMPANLYGPNDNFHPENSHVLPALLQRFHMAVQKNERTIEVWGSGNPKREFLYVEDMAQACIHIMNIPQNVFKSKVSAMQSHVNIGTGNDLTIRELSETIAKITGFNGEIKWDVSKPDGTPRKLLDVSLLKDLGWQYSTELEAGLMHTYRWFKLNINTLRC